MANAGPNDLVKLRLKFRPADDLPDSEGLWARPVDANDAGGLYELRNSSFLVPLAAGDTVRAALDGDSRLQVIDFHAASEAVLTIVQTCCDDADTQLMIDRWAGEGAEWTEGHTGILVTTWQAGLSIDEIGDVLRPDLGAERAEWLAAAAPGDRSRRALEEVDFELDTHQYFPPVETSYWAADDPYWATVGRDDPEFLAYVQTLAGSDERVARALERGQPERVLQYVDRINAPDPRALPPLDGPIFED